jgi:glycosyltransferase involved in cell wall biosynthesis
MNSTPLVSIVVPAYNHAGYLKECIESILAQDYPQVELIVLDDGSTDATPGLLRAYGERFRWESQANMGQSATLNKGWAMAKGEILGYLSADDALRPQAVSEAVAVLQSRPEIVATYSDFDLIDEHSRAVRTVATRDFDARDLVLDLVCQPGPGAFFRREAFLRAGPWNPELRQNPDLDFWLRLSLVGNFLRIPKVLAGFRVHEGSATYQSTNVSRADEPVLMTHRFVATSGLPRLDRRGKPPAGRNGLHRQRAIAPARRPPPHGLAEDRLRHARQHGNAALRARGAFAAQRADGPVFPPDPLHLGEVDHMMRRLPEPHLPGGAPR